MRLWPWSRFAALEERIDALEAQRSEWTAVPTRADVPMVDVAGLWREATTDFEKADYGEEDDWSRTGVYL